MVHRVKSLGRFKRDAKRIFIIFNCFRYFQRFLLRTVGQRWASFSVLQWCILNGAQNLFWCSTRISFRKEYYIFIFISDLRNASPLTHFILFVDDTNIFYSHSFLTFIYQVVNVELTQIADWYCANKLSLSSDSDSGHIENLLPQVFTL